jgi:ribonuclease HI
VFKWKKNGYRNASGLLVTNKKEFQDLDVLVRYFNKLDVGVLFWHVPRERNREADKLANMALDG